MLPVPATLRSCKPASSTINAWCRLPQITLRNPATAFRSGDPSVGLNNNGRRRYSLVAVDLIGGVRRSKIRSLYTSYMDMRIAYSADGSQDTESALTSGCWGKVDGRCKRRDGVCPGPIDSPWKCNADLVPFFRRMDLVGAMKCRGGRCPWGALFAFCTCCR